jgi:hypothetical protein
MKLKNKTVVEKVDRKEWDFSTVPAGEERGCCFFEWARESDYIRQELEHPVADGLRPPNQEGDARRKRLRNCHLVHALPGKNPGGIFERPWLAKSPEWRAEFCSRLKLCWDGLSFARSLDKMAYSGFHLGMSVFFKQEIWTENDIRRLDPGCGLETLLVTVNWSDFTDKEIIADFTKWLQSTDGRPSNYVGEFKNSTWWVCLERLAILRLLHYYTFEEIPFLELPLKWYKKSRFIETSEARRERRAAPQTLLTLYPFLSKKTKPRSWREAEK